MSELFDIPQTLSPRLAWMHKHGISCIEMPDAENAYYLATGGGEAARGNTAEEACIQLAMRLGIADWKWGAK